MELLNFKNWLVESFFSEMATLNFGGAKGHAGKDHTQTPTHYLQWMKDKINSGEGNFNVTDKGRKLSSQEILNLINQELTKRSGEKQSIPSPISPAKAVATSPAINSNSSWIWAKSISSRPDLGIPIADLDLAMKQNDESTWMFVIIDPEEGRLVSRGLIPTNQIKEIVRSQKNESGQLVRGNKPSDILQAITPKKEKSSNGMIPEGRITPEQKAIEDRFEKMINSPNQSHMVISALAGSGKTTVLKHLAWKFSKGQKWLYLVFNSKNKEEAKEEFPSNVQVETTNGWAGREVLGKNVEKPTDRIQGFSFSEKSRILADSPSFKKVMKSLGLPDQEELFGNDPRSLSGTERNIFYTIRSINNVFKSEVLRLLGLCKSFSVDPRKQDFLQSIDNVMQKYDFDTDLDEIKEKINKNSPWMMRELKNYMKQDFSNRNFKNEMINATSWMLHQVMPHGTEETFIADAGPKKGNQEKLGNKRDFDDDLWFSAIHADELKWPKYDVVLADEVQDFNVAQQIILKKLAENGAKIVAVGDQHQSIYRFRGADGDAFNQLKNSLQNLSHDKDVEQKLTSNFRSRQSIVDLSNEEGEKHGHVTNLVKGRPFKETPGKIGKGSATKYEMKYDDAFKTISDEMKDMGEIKQTAFLARTNEPLVHASLKLMKQGTPFIILGKDIANDLIKQIEKLTGLFKLSGEAEIEKLENGIDSYLTEMNDKHIGKSAMAGALKELKEVSDALLAAIGQFREESPDGSIFEFKKWLKNKFGGLDLDDARSRSEFKKKTEDSNPVILTTVHKSKGLQFQRVFILRDDLWPHPRSTREEDLEQEKNNRYIGRTRAEDELHILDLDGQPGYKKDGEK